MQNNGWRRAGTGLSGVVSKALLAAQKHWPRDAVVKLDRKIAWQEGQVQIVPFSSGPSGRSVSLPSRSADLEKDRPAAGAALV
jgi:hypothetical protein